MRLRPLAATILLVISLQGCLPIVAAGVGTGVLMAQDRRTNETFLADQKLEADISNLIAREFKSIMHINATSFNLNVLLTGEVPEEYSRAELGKQILKLPKVRNVYNELAISASSSLVSRSNDSLVTSNVKLRFLNNGRFNPEHIKVITENGTAYLLGIVYRAEAVAAANIASTTRGVKRVIKIFEYLD